MNLAQKNLIRNNFAKLTESEFQSFMRTDEILSLLFTDTFKEIKEILELTGPESVKMSAYSEAVLQRALPEVQVLKTGTGAGEVINDRVGWLMGKLKRKATDLGEKPDWGWCFDVMKYYGISRDPIRARAFTPKYKRPTTGPRSEYNPIKKTREEHIAQLEYDVKRYTEIVAEPEKWLAHVPINGPIPREFFIGLAHKNLASCIKQLAELKVEPCASSSSPLNYE